MSKSWEVITVYNFNMKIRFHVNFYVSLMDIFVSKHNEIHKYLYEEVLIILNYSEY